MTKLKNPFRATRKGGRIARHYMNYLSSEYVATRKYDELYHWASGPVVTAFAITPLKQIHQEQRRARHAEYSRQWRLLNPESHKRSAARRAAKLKSATAERKRLWRISRTNQCQQCGKPFIPKLYLLKEGKGRFCSHRCAWDGQRRTPEQALQFKITKTLRRRIYFAIRRNKGIKSGTTTAMLGCSVAFLKERLETQFKRGMTWKNYGRVWHIDHIRPCADFDLTKPEEQKKCFHWTNLQPLRSSENMRKSAKIIPHQQGLLLSIPTL